MERFPKNVSDSRMSNDDGYRNPSIQLFGRRFSKNMQPMNALAELLLVTASPKHILLDSNDIATTTFFPDAVCLRQLREEAKGLSCSFQNRTGVVFKTGLCRQLRTP